MSYSIVCAIPHKIASLFPRGDLQAQSPIEFRWIWGKSDRALPEQRTYSLTSE